MRKPPTALPQRLLRRSRTLPGAGVASTRASGRTASMTRRRSRALLPSECIDQRTVERRITGIGRTNRRPCHRQRRASASSRAEACRMPEITMRNEQPARPKPMRTPAERSSISGVVRIGHQGKPEGVGDRAAAQAPARCQSDLRACRRAAARAPHTMFWIAIAKREYVAAPAIGLRLRRQKKAERGARTKAEHGRSGNRTARSSRACASRCAAMREVEGNEIVMTTAAFTVAARLILK